MARGKSIITLRNQYIQLRMMSDEELEGARFSQRTKNNPEWLYALNKERIQRVKEKMEKE